MDPDQTAPIGAVCSGSTLFASIHNSSIRLGNYLQQTTSADYILDAFFSWRFKEGFIRQMVNNVTFVVRNRRMDNNLLTGTFRQVPFHYARSIKIFES